jgi:hypothetical protein
MNGNIIARLAWWMLAGRSVASVESVTLSNDTIQSAHGEYSHIAHTERVLSCPARGWRQVHAEVFDLPICPETRWGRGQYLLDDEEQIDQAGRLDRSSRTPEEVVVESSTTAQQAAATPSIEGAGDPELDTDSPLDNVNFLSFEDWKKQNLAKIGQSADNVGGRRPGAAETVRESRRRAGTINNALDSLGDESEIELDFGGFGAEAPDSNAGPGSWGGGDGGGGNGRAASDETDGEELGDGERAGSVAVGKRKDAGTTCKERFNYASFDCAATVLKTNPQCTGSSSVLIENKDSYMLNECRAENKFLILELCDDILVDTVVLANYEFFSSIFRTFRVSVSDRYPVKLDKWKELGVFEARNTREVQAFAIENPLIWARYVKFEFLTHYGNEFYCPVSLVRIHGTTMMEEYKNDGEPSRTDDETVEIAQEEPVAAENVQTTDATAISSENATVPVPTEVFWGHANFSSAIQLANPLLSSARPTETCAISEAPPTQETAQPIHTASVASSAIVSSTIPASGNISQAVVKVPASEESSSSTEHVVSNGTTSSNSSSSETPNGLERPSPTDVEGRPVTTNVKEESTAASEPTKTTPVQQPPSPNPTTQESFFKSVNKRLQMLESNSSLSLLYIEEQSRILREAFNKVEKRQLSKTTTFLEHLNTTVLTELREFRSQYDQIWRSVAIEFESQRFQYHQELYSVTAQLAVLADELVFQKRVSVIQSIFVLVCFGLVLFSRSSVGNYIDLPSVQSMVARGYSLRPSSPIFGTPTVRRSKSSTSYRANRGHQREASDDSQDGVVSPTISYSPPTPPSENGGAASPSDDGDGKSSPPSSRHPTPELLPQSRPGSSPAVLNGSDKAMDELGMTSPTAYLKTPSVTSSPVD